MSKALEKVVDKMSGKQIVVLLIALMSLLAVVIRPELAGEILPWSERISKEVVYGYIDEYMDLGLGGSPYMTEKWVGDFALSKLSVGGTTYYYSVNCTGGRMFAYSSVNAYNPIQLSLNATSWDSSGNVVWGWNETSQTTTFAKYGGTVYLGPHVFNIGSGNTLLVPNHCTFYSDGGIIIGAPGANPIIKNMWANFTYDVVIKDLWIESESGAGDTGILWDCYNATLPTGDIFRYALKLQDLHIRGMSNAFNLTTTIGFNTLFLVDNIRAGTGVVTLKRIFDSKLTEVSCVSADFYNIVTNYFAGWYLGSGGLTIGGGTEAYPCKGNILDGIRTDNSPVGEPALLITGWFTENILNDMQFANKRNVGDPGGSDTVVFNGTCTWNTISGSFFGNYPSRENTESWRHAIYFNANAANNSVVANTYQIGEYTLTLIYEENGPTMDNNIENRKQIFRGHTANAISNTQQYFPLEGVYIFGTTFNARATPVQMSGFFVNLRVYKYNSVPGGEWQNITLVHEDTLTGGAITVSSLEVDLAAGTNIGADTGYYYFDPGVRADSVGYRSLATDVSNPGVIKCVVDFYPDLEDWLLGRNVNP